MLLSKKQVKTTESQKLLHQNQREAYVQPNSEVPSFEHTKVQHACYDELQEIHCRKQFLRSLLTLDRLHRSTSLPSLSTTKKQRQSRLTSILKEDWHSLLRA